MADLLGGQDIAALLGSNGPVVKCVLLRSTPSNDNGDVTKQSTKDAPTIQESEPEMNGTSKKRKSDAISCAPTTPATEESQTIEQPPADKAATSTNGVVATSSDSTSSGRRPYEPLVELMEELEVDTTPRKSMVAQVLGGPFTFLGQYEEEGIMVIVRRPTSREEVESLSINPHQLQPPLDQVQVYGDILLMRVAPTDEVLDSDSEDDNDDNDKEEPNQEASPETVLNNKEEHGNGDQTGDPEEKKDTKEEATKNSTNEENAPAKIEIPTNDEFFLDYTKKEYIHFASRTDIIAPSIEEDEDGSDSEEEEEQEEEVEGDNDENEGEEGEDDEEDEDYDVEEEESEDEDEDSSVGMMNLVLGQILKRFRMENGRGPDTRELLEIRMALAERLGVDVPPIDEDGSNWDNKAVKKRRKLIQEEANTTTSTEPSSFGPSSSNHVKSILCRKETMEDDEEATETTTPATTDTSSSLSSSSSLTGTRRVQFNGLEEDESSFTKENGSESNHGNEPEFGEI